MNPIERIYKIQHLLQDRKAVRLDEFLDSLEVSLATFKRDLERLRDRFGAPVIYDRQTNTYRYEIDPASKQAKTHELPGLWFSEPEATALVTMQHLLSSLDQGGLLGPHLEPLMTRIDSILGGEEASSKELRQRIRVIPQSIRKTSTENFSLIGSALLKRQRIQMRFYSRASHEVTEREVSPQRLIFYKGNWYMDAWCHLRDGLRSFAIDAAQHLSIQNKPCKELPNKTLDEFLTTGYGIFSGKATKKVILRFKPDMARWVSSELWHPDQIGQFDQGGHYTLEFPYSQDTELAMDIMRYGSNVEVLAPADLRRKVSDCHAEAAKLNA